MTLRDVEDFGNPAVNANNSMVILSRCRLGLSTLGLGGGPCLVANGSTVHVAEPTFDTGFGGDAITSNASVMTIAGSTSSRIVANSAVGVPASAIVADNSVVIVDPAILLAASPAGAPATTGNGCGSRSPRRRATP